MGRHPGEPMVDQRAQLSALIERVIAVKHELDTLDTDEPLVRPRPPASYARLAHARRAVESRGVAMPRDLERVLRVHDGIDHLWRAPSGSLTLFSHLGLLGAPRQPPGARAGVVIAASDAGDAVCLVPGASAPAVVLADARGQIVERVPSVTAWLEWILRTTTEARDERTAPGRRRWPASTPTPFEP